MMTLDTLNHKDLYFPVLPVVNILCDIRAANYIAIVGIVKPSEIGRIDAPAMLGRRLLKRKIKNKNRPQLPFW
jgi:hypothetical protein